MTRGIYHLVIHLAECMSIEVGKLGVFLFPAGYYVYTGSALGGLDARVSRHLRSEKRLHWHIDYLLQYAEIIHVVTHATGKRLECEYNRAILSLPDASIPVKGFGSSDCRCPAHLVYFEKKPSLAAIQHIGEPPGEFSIPSSCSSN